jgi:tetratricopeptide (TPR) repeat protein
VVGAFVGEERRRIVSDVASRYDEVVRTSKPHLICLVAEAGWGKTRVIQEFYSWLQKEHQPAGVYWPAEMAPTETDPMLSRKVVYPAQVSVYPDLPMPWLWLGLLCEEGGGGRKLRALLNDGVQLPAHLGALIEVAERHAGDRDLAMTVLGEAIGFVPGVGQIVSALLAAKELVPRLRERLLSGIAAGAERGRREQAPRSVDLLRLDGAEIGPYIELVKQFVSPDLPLVLAVDDAHHADPGTVKFVATIQRLEAPILVICTAWPSVLADQVEEERALDREERVSFGSLLDELEQEDPGSVSRVDLAPLTDDDLGAMVKEVAPTTSDESQRALVETSGGNPLVLRLQMTSPKVLRSISGEAIMLSPDELHQLPRKYERLIGERFDDLGELDQRWLVEAALQGGEFLPEYMTASTKGLDQERIGAFVRRIRSDDTELGRFIEPPVRHAILSAAAAEFSAGERDSWGRETLIALQRNSAKVPKSGEARGVWRRLLVRLAEENADSDLVEAAIVADAALGLSFEERDRGSHEDELKAADAAVGWAERDKGDCHLRAATMTRRAAALRANNNAAAAVGQADAVVGLLEEEPSDDSTDLSDALYVLAAALLQDQQPERAREIAIRAEQETEGVDARIAALGLLSEAEVAMHDLSAATAAIEKALEIATSVDPPNVEQMIRLETDLTDLDPLFSSPDRWESHLETIEGRLGTGHWLYRYCLLSLAFQILFSTGDIARVDPVIERIESLPGPDPEDDGLESLRGLRRVLQTGDSKSVADVLVALSQAPYSSSAEMRKMRMMAEVVGGTIGSPDGVEAVTGDVDGPYALLRQLYTEPDAGLRALADQMRISAGTWSAMDQVFAVQVALGILGDRLLATGAVHPASAELVEQIERLIAADGDFPVLVRRLLASYLAALEVLDGGDIGAVEDRLPPSLFGKTLAQYAVAAHASGRQPLAEEFLAQAEALCTDEASWAVGWMIGEAHQACESPKTEAVWRALAELPDLGADERLQAEVKVATCLYRDGRYPEAEKMERLIVKERQAMGGEDEPATQQAKFNLAMTLEAMDKSEESRDLLQAVVDSRARLLGPDDSLTADARRGLARVLSRLGKGEEAERLMEETLLHYRRGLGDDDGLTLVVMSEFAEILNRNGKHEEAQEYVEHVVVTNERGRGLDDMATWTAKSLLAVILYSQDLFVPTLCLEREVVRSCSTTRGPEDLVTLEKMLSLAMTHFRLRQYVAAGELEKAVFEARKRKLGEDHLDTLLALESWAGTLWEMKERERAIEAMAEVVDQHSSGHRPDDPAAKQAAARLAAMREAEAATSMSEHSQALVGDGSARD